MYRKMLVRGLTALLVLAPAFAVGATGDKARVKGMINGRTGETLIVKSDDGNVTIVLTDDTKTQDRKGLFGLEKKQMSSVVLIPGLKVDVDGTYDDQNRVVAKTITVDGHRCSSGLMVSV